MLSKRELLMQKTNAKKYLQQYLAELNAICTQPINEDQLLSLEKTYDIIEQIKSSIPSESFVKEQIEFDQKERIRQVVNESSDFFVNGLYLFTEHSKMCGALYLENIRHFNSDFVFTTEHAGIISLINKEVTYKLLFDFYEEKSTQLMEIEQYKKLE